MRDFVFNTTPSIVMRRGAAADLGAILAGRLGSRVVLVTDAGVRKLGLIEGAVASLRDAGVAVTVVSHVHADPPESDVAITLDAIRAHEATGVLAIGGGSPMDVAKVAALIARSGETLAEAYGVGRARGPRLPLALVPTTAGTGSEVTPVAILTTGETEKKGIVSPFLLPDIAILDADLTLGLPPPVTAATGIDAMVHAIEAYASASPANNPISRGLARQALQLLGANIRTVVETGHDVEARAGMLLGSLLAGQAFANAPVAAVHALAYPLGSHFHVPHGLSNALVLPHVLRFNLPAAADAYAAIAADAFPDLVAHPAATRAEAFVTALQSLSAEIGLPQRLRDVGVGADALPTLARDAMKQTRLLVNNPRPMTEEAALATYRQAF
jgi:alcohol dehydrogenase class IV